MRVCLDKGFQAALAVQLSKLRCGCVQPAKIYHAWGLQDWSLLVYGKDDEQLMHD